MAGDQLHVVDTAAEDARILVRAGDPGTGNLVVLVDVQQHVLVVAEIVAVVDGALVFLDRELLGGVAADHLVELGGRLGQVCIDATVLDVSPHHHPVEVGGDVPPLLRAGMRAADEHARRGWQRLVAQELPAGFGRPGAEVRAVAVVDEAGLVDATCRRRDLRIYTGSGSAAGHRRRALHGGFAVAAT